MWSGTILVVLSVAVAVWCLRLQPPEQVAPRPIASETSRAPTFVAGGVERAGAATATCDFGELLIIAANPQPSQSAASVRMQDGSTQTRRPGETLAGYFVEAIHLDRVEFRRGAERCALEVADSRPNEKAAPRGANAKRYQLTYNRPRHPTPRREAPSIQVL